MYNRLDIWGQPIFTQSMSLVGWTQWTVDQSTSWVRRISQPMALSMDNSHFIFSNQATMGVMGNPWTFFNGSLMGPPMGNTHLSLSCLKFDPLPNLLSYKFWATEIWFLQPNLQQWYSILMWRPSMLCVFLYFFFFLG